MKVYFFEKFSTNRFKIPMPCLALNYVNNATVQVRMLFSMTYIVSSFRPSDVALFTEPSGLCDLSGNDLYFAPESIRKQLTFSVVEADASVGSYGTRHDRQIWVWWADVYDPFKMSRFVPYYQYAAGCKLSPSMSEFYFNSVELASISAPFLTSNFDDFFMTVSASQVFITGDSMDLILDHGFGDANSLRETLLPHIRLSQNSELSVSSPATITAQIVDSSGEVCGDDMEIFFEAINCRVSHDRRQTLNGVTTIQVTANDGVLNGQTVRVKAGTKFVTGLSDRTITVV